MDKIYIFGHQNPDTDAVCAAISLSYLKNKQGLNTEARVLGHISKETKFVLNYFNQKEPQYLNDVKLQLKDLEYHKGLFIDENESIINTYNYLIKESVTGTPIIYNNNKYKGIVTIQNIAKELIKGDFNKLDASYNNIVSAINGKEVLKFDDLIIGKILTASYRSTTFINSVDLQENNILIVGDRYSIIEEAIDKKIKLLIITGNGQICDEHIQKAKENKVNIITTSYDTFYTSKLIGLSNSVRTIMNQDESKIFHENDYYDYFKEATKKLKHNNYPILNSKNECLGLLRVTDILKKNKKQVMLVDHQEIDQSVDGLEEAEILEIVDHHKIGNINTSMPINFRNMIVGSSNTIIYTMYKEGNIKIPKEIAGIMLSGILSDTLCLQSPTTTPLDKNVVEELSKIAGVDYKDYAYKMFTAGTSLEGLTINKVIKSDFKTFPHDNKKFAVGQVFTLDKDRIFNELDNYLNELNEIKQKEGYMFIILLVTDIIKNGSYLLFTQDAKNILESAYNIDNIKQTHYIDGLVSRKKQILPLILEELN
ncbi:MAG: putative manganese-dependent inorganic diphosphatase [Bacilli bacterium]|nr:putative manganese-dependent inorganic diphosphatase [Bacilli bacterium]